MDSHWQSHKIDAAREGRVLRVSRDSVEWFWISFTAVEHIEQIIDLIQM